MSALLKRLLRRKKHGDTTYTAKCGHNTHLIAKVTAFGETVEMTLEPNEDGSLNYCIKCLEKMTLQCPLCEGPIFIDTPIVFYPKKEGIAPFIGCATFYCTTKNPSKDADRRFRWIPGKKGKGKASIDVNIEMIERKKRCVAMCTSTRCTPL